MSELNIKNIVKFVKRARALAFTGIKTHSMNPRVDMKTLDDKIKFTKDYTKDGKTVKGPELPVITYQDLVRSDEHEPKKIRYFIDSTQRIDQRYMLGLIAPRNPQEAPKTQDDMVSVGYAPIYESMDAWIQGKPPFAIFRSTMEQFGFDKMFLNHQLFELVITYRRVAKTVELEKVLKTGETNFMEESDEMLIHAAKALTTDPKASDYDINVHFESHSEMLKPLRKYLFTVLNVFDSLPEHRQKQVLEEYNEEFMRIVYEYRGMDEYRGI